MRRRSGILRRFRRSREAGIFGLLVFVTGVLVLPFLHNLHHRNDHDHGAGGWHAHGLSFGGHHHVHRGAAHDHEHEDDGHDHHGQGLAFGGHGHPHRATEHSHGHDDDDHDHRQADHEGEDEDDRNRPDPEHGKGSLEHFGVAVTATQLFVLSTSHVLVEQPVPPRFESAYVARYQLGPLQPRAPPA
jgi:hypothetical protein